MKKILCLGTTLMLSMLALVGCSSSSESNNDDLKVTMITSVGGINDQSFNQSSWEGLQEIEKDFGIKVNYIESKQEAEYATNIETAVDGGADLILGTGFPMQQAILDAAKNYPDQKFAIVDVDYGQDTPENVVCITFTEEQAGYIVGLVAGKETKTNKVGFVGGMDNEVIKKFEVGYKAGVAEANPDADVQVQYVNSFVDAAKGKSIAQQMYSNGADIIFSAAGDSGVGVIEMAKEKDLYAIGVDRDQSSLAPENVLTSAMKKVNEGVYNTVKSLIDGNFEGGSTLRFGLEDNSVGLAPTTNNISQETLDYVNEKIEQIINNEITVPSK
ncbi:BMP family ABC transporter substrate-binding protein [Romboutsia sp. CE17]|uniref:BMP family lipoprotein n=1 Tax=Romboutsia sp. CE17 TaxID=2724150 RepID=UPI001442C0A2|nr:BMP family ABC transporter substrate-binding protein [Romboutsia sp. CE17]QJA09330.1 BMP family ABC transporter substrate-binding protein [Romboutsia sp. CE17]